MTDNRAYLALVCSCGTTNITIERGRCTNCNQLITTPARWHCHCNHTITIIKTENGLACTACNDTFTVEDPAGYAYNV